MNDAEIVRIDGIKWCISKSKNGGRALVPICPTHHLRMTAASELDGPMKSAEMFTGLRTRLNSEALSLQCAEGPHVIKIPREYDKEKQYVIDRIDAKIFAGIQTVNLDEELVPVSKEKIKDDKYFLATQIMESKRGKQVVIYAGEKGSNEKSQIIIDKENRRLSFDQKDLNPADIFAEIKVTFKDGTKHTIQGKSEQNNKEEKRKE